MCMVARKAGVTAHWREAMCKSFQPRLLASCENTDSNYRTPQLSNLVFGALSRYMLGRWMLRESENGG